MTQAVMGIQTGWRVHDRSGEDLGAVTRLDDRSLWIRRGRIFHHEVAIPRSLVREAEDGHVELEISLDELDG
jgi:hypothetical protein